MAIPTYLANGTVTSYTLISNIANTNANLLFTVNSINVTAGGTSYNYVPQIDITGGGGVGAQAIATIDSDGHVANIRVTNQGIGYTSVPTVHIRGNGSVGTVIIANSGGGYSNTPTAIFSAPTYANGATDPHGVTANATLVLAQNSIAQVIIGDTGTHYTSPPTILVTAAQNNYPSYQAQLTAVLNTGVGATATANILPYYTSNGIEGGSYYLRSVSSQMVSWDVTNTFVGNIYLEGSLSPQLAGADWFNIKRLNVNATSSTTGQETITGKFKWVRARVEDFAAGTINTLKIMYPYVG